MKRMIAKDYGVIVNQPVTKQLSDLFKRMTQDDEEKELVFEKGIYYIDSQFCDREMLFITNTVGDKEFSKKETPHSSKIALHLKNIKNLTLQGNGAQFVIEGKVTNMTIRGCENITVNDIEIITKNPDMHMFRVIGKSRHSVDFQLDRESRYAYKNGRLYLYGQDYRVKADYKAYHSYWNGLIRKEMPNTVRRVPHPLQGMLNIKEIAPYRFRVRYLSTARFHVGDSYYIYDARRQYAGIFVDRSKDISLFGVKQRFNYSLAFVAQDSENITIDQVEFAPEKQSERQLASAADFLQICMCRGRVRITNSYFDGAGDDCMNVHGVHFKITECDRDRIKVRFMHPQTHGYNPFREGDEIAFIHSASLLQTGKAKVLSSQLMNEYEIVLRLDQTENAVKGNVVENVSACPQVYFAGNTLNRIITRGVLLTNREKSVIENNHFISNSMSGILLSDDARSWYESGMCLDVMIRGNIFDYCGETPILIKPENWAYSGPIHKNIAIADNQFKQYDGVCISARSAKGITITNNRFSGGAPLKTSHCEDVVTDF